MNEINVILNGKPVVGKAGESVLDLAKRNGIEIPTLCHDPRLEPYSSCFVCVVEIEGMRGLQPSCSTKITEGMKINTDNDKIHKARKSALDLIVSNHYADCVAPCKQTCPAGVDVQGYISLIEKGMYSEAVALIKQVNPLPAVCGRVCVRPCEAACRRNLLEENAGVGIDYMKRFASDMDLQSPNRYIAKAKPATGKKVAIIGAGPGGLSAAWFLQLEGHYCDIYEASPKPGGWLRYGIPEYRLPNDIIDKEVNAILELGLSQIHYNQKLGDNLSYKNLKQKYDAVILTIGSQGSTPVGCEGDDAENVFGGVDFLRNMEITGQRYNFKGKTVAVIGGGNTAMDCCRTSIRCHADKVYVLYRRTENEMPANPIEIHESKLEGVEYMFLTAPKKINKDENGKVKSITCLKMELGEPDASGRRRPVPVEGSDFDLPVDYILAAIGQKTLAPFIEDINQNADNGKFALNKYGNIDVNPATLQTGIPNVFSAGDAVKGPATAIEAIAQARRAALSCHQYLTGQEIKAEDYEFISRKDNFKKQTPTDYKGKFVNKNRHEMPTLQANQRLNFNEVELGYENEQVAQEEASRCLECGCVEYYTCDLKKHSTEYHATQENFKGDFREYNIRFDHPFIEIDNNKCILCARCVRICNEVVGANALGLVNRGFDTYVAPNLGLSLTETDCESCGLCISACPTAAISENVIFKPGPIKTEPVNSICNYCSVGCELEYHTKKDFVWRVTGANGFINKDTNICSYAKFGYNYINDKKRLTTPLYKENGTWKQISFEEAFKIITEQLNKQQGPHTAFFTGGRLTNEEMLLAQKLATTTNSTIGSFQYIGRGNGYAENSFANVPFDDIEKAEHIYILGTEINYEHPVVGYMIFNHQHKNEIQVSQITTIKNNKLTKKVNNTIVVDSYYYFIKAANHYLLSNNLQNQLFINQNSQHFEVYKTQLLSEKYEILIQKSGVDKATIEKFAKEYNEIHHAIIVFSEKNVSANASLELQNLALITGKLGKTAMGLISLKEKNNSEGLFNLGIGEGLDNFNKITNLNDHSLIDKLNSLQIKNFFIFGEDPIGTAIDKAKVEHWFNQASFIVVQDYFMTETAQKANLILPASLPYETGGSFTNTQRTIQKIEKQKNPPFKYCNIGQLIALAKKLGIHNFDSVDDVHEELNHLFANAKPMTFVFRSTEQDNQITLFKNGCDNINQQFMDYFDKKLTKKNKYEAVQ
ncbi:MAG TPA: molybdopterin-dependent oxidoreductase [Bacteroidales bacterium]|nr:molybdopterin-dependent oxidoreductase [Bacteroidales bacterium]